eukprot:TRINITY_DN1440_c0_g1_i4.p1 TRINITY_DN1440_c0_g1~~TRINITY_DN1440_c0_g1_i4.p1  ORF type:complete len:463 (+),score=106.12 TRINITY_DN1440_c0_g1_i4:49-1389(+)
MAQQQAEEPQQVAPQQQAQEAVPQQVAPQQQAQEVVPQQVAPQQQAQEVVPQQVAPQQQAQEVVTQTKQEDDRKLAVEVGTMVRNRRLQECIDELRRGLVFSGMLPADAVPPPPPKITAKEMWRQEKTKLCGEQLVVDDAPPPMSKKQLKRMRQAEGRGEQLVVDDAPPPMSKKQLKRMRQAEGRGEQLVVDDAPPPMSKKQLKRMRQAEARGEQLVVDDAPPPMSKKQLKRMRQAEGRGEQPEAKRQKVAELKEMNKEEKKKRLHVVWAWTDGLRPFFRRMALAKHETTLRHLLARQRNDAYCKMKIQFSHCKRQPRGLGAEQYERALSFMPHADADRLIALAAAAEQRSSLHGDGADGDDNDGSYLSWSSGDMAALDALPEDGVLEGTGASDSATDHEEAGPGDDGGSREEPLAGDGAMSGEMLGAGAAGCEQDLLANSGNQQP